MEYQLGNLFNRFTNMFENYGVYIKTCTKAEIETYIFEEFDLDVIGLLHKNIVHLLEMEGLIDSEISQNCAKLRESFFALKGTELWNIQSVKNALEWINILKLVDKIRGLIHQRWTQHELDEIYKINQYCRVE